MKRNLLIQMKNEWKENFWLCLELTVVSVAVWCLLIMMTWTLQGLFEPRGFDYGDVYVGQLKRVSKTSPQFAAYEDTTEAGRFRAAADDIRLLLERIGSTPYVEAVGAGSNALPYNYNFSGNQYFGIKDNGDTLFFQVNVRQVTSGMAEVLRYESLTDQTSPQMRQALQTGKSLLAPGTKLSDSELQALQNSEIRGTYDGAEAIPLGGIINVVRRSDYEPAYAGTLIRPIDETNDRELYAWTNDVSIRVKPGQGERLMEEFRNNPGFSRQRNLVMRNLRPLSRVRTMCQWSQDVNLRQYGSAIICLCVIVFLGLLGTFWFRMQQRVGEIAIRKVAGATSRDIFRRMIGESLLLVVVSTAVAWLVDIALIHWHVVNIDSWESMWKMLLGCALGVMALLILAVLAGVYFPARRAMKIEPAVALKSE